MASAATTFLEESLEVVHESRAKKSLFLATVETILLYGCKAWTLATEEQIVSMDATPVC